MFRRLRYGISCCLLIWTTVVCTSCMDIIELRSEAFLIGMGIDTGDSADELQVSVIEVLLSPSQSSEGAEAAGGTMSKGKSGGGGQYRVITSNGDSMADCLRDIRLKLQKKLVLSKISYIVFSEAAARKGIKKEIDFLARASDFDQTAHLFVSEGKAADLLQKDQGKLLDFTTKGYSFLPAYLASEFWRVGVRMLNNGLESAALNRININGDILIFEGESYLLQDKLAYSLSTRDSKFTNILLNKKSGGLYISAYDPAQTTLEISHLARKTKYERKHVQLSYKLRAWVIESGVRKEIQNKAEIEQAAAKRIQKKLQQLLQETKELGIDMLGIGEKFRQRNWNTTDWHEQIKKLDIGVEVKVEILSGSGKSDFEK
ncbi:Ger(x)C family spore germination protein [Paenibacillus psychroresistens]|uniref:Ger(X)C family spore germination protein n=1 Tax=Paenibacillus psychroresistens TaxID=1778678 RepID=A0A6B8RTX8_9BACL|nr:Ger(x)C family spore germination protein [Paenibacillus psychroresistens]QGQ99851.1 Ger(x)C family spore germination protein [Paenibacillus psychroresistens]